MEWWQLVSMVGTVVLTATAVATLGWRMLERMRIENRVAHDKIGESVAELRSDMNGEIAKLRDDVGSEIAKVRDDLGSEIAKVRDDLGSENAKTRDDLGSVREGLAELRGEVRGMNRSLQDLREDFRVHVYGGTVSA